MRVILDSRKSKKSRGAKDKLPVFTILGRRGKVRVKVVNEVNAESL